MLNGMINNIKFKVLMYAGAYVDLIKIHSGIYTADVPTLYAYDTTLADIERKWREAAKIYTDFNIKPAIANLRKCHLIEIGLVDAAELKGKESDAAYGIEKSYLLHTKNRLNKPNK